MEFQVRMDELRFVNQEGLENADGVIANSVMELIETIGTPTTYSEPSIQAARKAYDELTQPQKDLVSHYQDLVDSENAFAQFQQQGTVSFPQDVLHKPLQSTDDVSFMISSCDSTNPVEIHGANTINIAQAQEDDFTVFVGKRGYDPVQIVSTHSIAIHDYARDDLAVKLQLYISDISAMDMSGQLEITSSGGADQEEYHWRLSQMDLQNGWNNVYLTFREAYNTNGAADLTNINYMRIYVFLSKPVVMAINDIRIVKQMNPELNEDFTTQESLAKWESETATLSFNDGKLQVEGNNTFSFETSAYPLHILQPARTPLEFQVSASGAAVETLTVEMIDFQGKRASLELDVTKLSNTPTYLTVVPSDMETQPDFSFETIETVLFHVVTKGQTTLLIDNIATIVREGKYWRDWAYHYQPEVGDYSIAVIPDIQELTAVHPQKLSTVFKWITVNQEDENIRFAIDVGDITWNGHAGSSGEFRTAASAFKTLQIAGFDYSIAYGNHDVQANRNTTLLNQAFPLPNISKFPSYGGVMTPTVR